MRLLDTETGQFVEKDPEKDGTVYAILSHTWDAKGEQTYEELKKIQGRYKLVSRIPVPQPRPSGTLASLRGELRIFGIFSAQSTKKKNGSIA